MVCADRGSHRRLFVAEHSLVALDPRFSGHGHRMPCEREPVWQAALLSDGPALRPLRDLRCACDGGCSATSPRSIFGDYVRHRDACVSG